MKFADSHSMSNPVHAASAAVVSRSRRRAVAMAASVLALGCGIWSSGAAAQTNYPDKIIRMVVAFSAGGPNDVMARVVAQKMSGILGQQVIVDNRPGAGGMIGTDFVAKSPADGYTLLFASVPFVTAPSMYKRPTYAVERDFVGVSKVAVSPIALMVKPGAPYKNVGDLIAFAKANPNTLNFASGGVGSTPHLAMVLFQDLSGAKLNHVPYKGGAPALTDLMGGQVDIMMDSFTTTLPYIEQKKVTVLAVGDSKRAAKLPSVPTMVESGVNGFVMNHWVGVVAPKQTPKPVVDKLNAAVNQALKDPAVRDRLVGLGAEPAGDSPQQFQAFLKGEVERWQKVAKDAKIELE